MERRRKFARQMVDPRNADPEKERLFRKAKLKLFIVLCTHPPFFGCCPPSAPNVVALADTLCPQRSVGRN